MVGRESSGESQDPEWKHNKVKISEAQLLSTADLVSWNEVKTEALCTGRHAVVIFVFICWFVL